MEALRTHINPADFSSEGMARDNERTEQDSFEQTAQLLWTKVNGKHFKTS